MDLETPLNQIVQKQATVGDILDEYMAGGYAAGIAEKYGLDANKVAEIIRQADDEGKFIPSGATPEPEASPKAEANAKAKLGTMTTKDNV